MLSELRAHADDERFFARLRSEEFARLDARGAVYLDFTGAALPAQSQVDAHASWLKATVTGNPHAEHGPSLESTQVIDDTRARVLRFLDAAPADYVVCFTANATAAIKLVAESYGFGPRRGLALTADNHNSMNGLREYARGAGGLVTYVPLVPNLRLGDASPALDAVSAAGGGLFGFPAQSNFSGVRHPLALVGEAHARGLDVLLDAAAYVPTASLSLRTTPADFVAISFYKIFGYPTGVGALVARRDALGRLVRPWFAGGTVHYASVAAHTHRLRPSHGAFEDGTPAFLEIAALAHGFDLLERVGRARVERRIERLTATALAHLEALRHATGAPMVRLYGPAEMAARGGTIAFNVCDPAGHAVPYENGETLARHSRVALRGGCFCNPGAAETAFGLDAPRLHRCFASLGDGFTIRRLAACTGRAAGALRLSVGLATNDEDLERAAAVVRSIGAASAARGRRARAADGPTRARRRAQQA